uniref:DUF5745 domain-containing protein n=1 Tax=Gadus morhua TaxID=8049 RepID=A0A8C5ALF7_GADMO
MYFLAVLYCVHSYYILYITYGHITHFWHIIPNSVLFIFFQDIVESTATSPPTTPSCSSNPGTSSTTPDTPSKRRVPGSRRGMRRARQSWRNDWVDVANDLLRKCGVNFRLTKLADCVGNVFLAFYENILGVKVPGVIADPKTPEDDIHNVQSVIDSLALDYLQISLSHITGENLVRGDKESIKNLLEIFDGLLEYLNEEISEELHNGGLNEGLTEVFLPAVGRDGLRSTEQVVADMLERTSLSSSEW